MPYFSKGVGGEFAGLDTGRGIIQRRQGRLKRAFCKGSPGPSEQWANEAATADSNPGGAWRVCGGFTQWEAGWCWGFDRQRPTNLTGRELSWGESI